MDCLGNSSPGKVLMKLELNVCQLCVKTAVVITAFNLLTC